MDLQEESKTTIVENSHFVATLHQRTGDTRITYKVPGYWSDE